GIDAAELGSLIVAKFGENWEDGHWIILSALDLAQLGVLADALDAFAQAVIHEAHEWHAVYEAMMGTPYVYSLYYWMTAFRDLGAFIDSVAYFSEHEAVVEAAVDHQENQPLPLERLKTGVMGSSNS
ncbi:MAG: hypothetical protein IIB81_04890, partial [Nanoarchaeota archaeon]|nr:hypothetical protein [Nanoarchaeota archaeon]